MRFSPGAPVKLVMCYTRRNASLFFKHLGHNWKAALKLFTANPTAVDLACHYQLLKTSSKAMQFCVFSQCVCIFIHQDALVAATNFARGTHG